MMKDITSYFTTPRKCETVNPKSPSSNEKKQSNGSCEKRKLESGSDGDDGVSKSKQNSTTQPSVTPKFSGNLTVVLTQIDLKLPQTLISKQEPNVRVFKNVLLKSLPKREEETKRDDEPPSETKASKKRLKRKRIRIPETDSSDDEKSDSSAKLFKENKKPAKSAAAPNRRSDANNLFNYFSKAEKKPAPPADDNDSPVKCHRVVHVKALIHSPPRARENVDSGCECEAKLTKTSHPNIDDVRLPVVKIVRADYAKLNALDEIIEIGTDFVDTSTIKSKPQVSLSADESESSSDNFMPPKIQPWKMRVQFVSGGKLRRNRKKSESKEKQPRDASESAADKETPAAAEACTDGAAVGKSSAAEAAAGGGASKEIDGGSMAGVEGAEKAIVGETGTGADAIERPAEGAVDAAEKSATPISQNEATPPAAKSDATPVSEKKKLAPLFCRTPAPKKVAPKPVDTEARRLFLESGVPENIKKRMEEQKNSTVEESIHREYRFPDRTHVQQIETTNWVWNLKEVTSFNLKSTDKAVSIPPFDSIVSLVSQRKPAETSSGQEKLNVAAEVSKLKKQEPDVNVGDVFASVKKLGKEVNDVNGTLCWTEKYKPTSYSDVIGNSTNLLKLKEWIESHKKIRFRLSGNDEGSSDDFIDSDDSSCSVDTRNNVVVLVGPPGCGKTCAVYALANELGFKIIEVNAASNRNGKRILDELQEATQSHRVKRTSIFDKDMKKSKKKKKDSSHEKKTMSLILIEDADIIFDNYDDGFLSALSSLTLHSKRPFIFTVNNLNHPHLLKYTKGQSLVLTFAYPTVSLLNVWLRSIALNEGVRLSDEVLLYLFHIAGLDIRKSLLQLQVLISTNKCQSTLSREQLFYTDWWKRIIKMGKCRSAYKITDKVETRPKKLFSEDEEDDEPVPKKLLDLREETLIRAKSKSEAETDAKALTQLASLFERIAILGNFEPANSSQCVMVPGQETTWEQFSASSYHSPLTDDIADTIKTQIFSNSGNTDTSFSFREYYGKIRINEDIRQIVDNVFHHFSPKPSNSVSKYCDYLPAIRDIARIESCKVSGQRRSSRYFSYLNSINVHVSEKETRFLSSSLL